MVRSTTIIGLRHKGRVALGGDGQVSYDETILKTGANKIRRMQEGKILAGFAGSAADALTLFERFESKIDEFEGNLPRAAVELAKEWRTDRYLRRLEALMVVLDKKHALWISGNGDVVEPDDNVVSIGSGGNFALAAARALMKHSKLNAEEIVKESLKVAASICVFSNDKIMVETL
jgi:ATP-dependent HslUV protease subunit HslV